MRALAVMLALVACGPHQRPTKRTDGVPWASSGVDWSAPPALQPAALWQRPQIQEATLANGIRILVVENHRLPVVSVAAVHVRAGGREDGTTSGLAALTADAMVDRSSLETTVATDATSQYAVLASANLADALGELARIITKAEIDDATIARLRDERVRTLTGHRDNPRTVAAQIFDRIAFGSHPYGAPAEGLPEQVAKLTPAAVRAFYKRAYRPDALTLVLAGDVSLATARQLAQQSLGGWKAAAPTPAPAAALAPYMAQLAYVDLPGATEAVVIVGRRTPTIADTQRLPAELATSILGGGSDGKLDHVLHGEHAYTFGASAGFWHGVAAGSWTATATFRTEVAGDAIRTMLALIESSRTTAPTTEELVAARKSYARSVALAFETTAGITRALQRDVTLGRDMTWYAGLNARLAAVSAQDLQNAVTEHWRDLSVVVVGDWSKLGDSLNGLGLPVVAYRADGTRQP